MQTILLTVPTRTTDRVIADVLAFTDGATSVPSTGYWRPDVDGASVESEPMAALIVSADPPNLLRAALAGVHVLADVGERAAYVLTDGGALVLDLTDWTGHDVPAEARRLALGIHSSLAYPDALTDAWRDVAGPEPVTDALARLLAALAERNAAHDAMLAAEAAVAAAADRRLAAEERVRIARADARYHGAGVAAEDILAEWGVTL